MSGYPTQAAFAEQVSTVFSATVGEGVVEFTLEAVLPGIETQGYAPFALEFTAPGDAPLPQSTYLLGHGVLGEHSIFLVPISADGTTVRYEAVFNVAKESEG